MIESSLCQYLDSSFNLLRVLLSANDCIDSHGFPLRALSAFDFIDARRAEDGKPAIRRSASCAESTHFQPTAAATSHPGITKPKTQRCLAKNGLGTRDRSVDI